MDEHKYITAKQLADILGVHRNTLINWCREGMPALRISRKIIRYDLAAVIKWAREREEQRGAR